MTEQIYASEDLQRSLEEMHELIGVPPEGLRALDELARRGAEAKRQGFWLEAITIRAYFIDYWLRVLVGGHTGRRYKGGLTLGALLERAKDCHLGDEIVGRIQQFIEDRNEATHRLVRGRTKYEELKSVLDKDRAIANDLALWVLNHGVLMHLERIPLIIGPDDSPDEASDGT